jgi:hypothetical protein
MFYGILLSVIFTVSKVAGEVLFGTAFWLIARTIKRGNIVRQYLIIAAIGLVLLFTSNQASLLINTPYPPFGIITTSVMGLSSYLVLIGIYSSAISVRIRSYANQFEIMP